MMRQRFDRIEVIDLRGDVRAGPRGDVDADQGVFNIQVGTAITLAIADGSKAEGTLATVHYTDSWKEGLFTRGAKLRWLTDNAEANELPNSVGIDRDALEDWRPRPFENGNWLSIREAFAFSKSGMKSGNDPVFVAVRAQDLEGQVGPVLVGRANPSFDERFVRALAYRPFDRRQLYNDLPLLNRPGPDMQRAWGDQNLGLYSLKSNTGAGPGVWCHGLLPDYHAIKGSNGGYAFPLYDRRAGPAAHNLNPALVAALAEAYGEAQTPEDIFDAILCLLSAQSYTRRFAEDLEDTFPHIPFPADPGVFVRAVEIGREIRALEAFQREPAEAFQPRGFCRIVGQPDDGAVVADIAYAEGTLSLWTDGNAAVPAFTSLPQAVWDFSVSGYRVLPRWIEGRKGLPVTLALMRELRDVAARIHELLHWFAQGDLVLEATLADTLTREELGFAPEVEAVEADDNGE